MKTLLLLFATMVCAHAAAPWDGEHADLTVLTMMASRDVLPNLPWAGVSRVTEIFVKSTDRTVTGFRVVAHLRSKADMTCLAPLSPRGYMSVAIFSDIDVKDIASVTITRLHDGVATVLEADSLEQ